jgi:hypothetical protein
MKHPLAALKAFTAHRSNAKQRGIGFEFTIEDWWHWWQTDDRWVRRGRGKDSFVMARFGDVGPYSITNVYCSTVSENSAAGGRKSVGGGRKRIGDLPMTPAERQARRKARVFGEIAELREALVRVSVAASLSEARVIAAAALAKRSG